ncbi:hypothetical protein [Peribacillus frigoritolerans]|uniref:Uncharacterized protein n=1 Tax=Peribacillus castrilensis TaxID=2897690 RepID=A0AAW9NGD7_9BACI|nr:hypothetical protein [Peribacillus castrilensis]
MAIFKLQSGLIFDDQFQNLDPRWINSPSGQVSIDNNYMVLNHSDGIDGTKSLFELPSENNLVFQVEAEYIPTEIGDTAGIVIWNNALNKLEFLESVEQMREDEYPIWQARKRGNLWSFFAQRSNQWEMFDSAVILNPPMAGVVLKGTNNDSFVPLKIKRTILCKGTSVTVGNLSGGYRIELVDEDDQVVKYQVVPENFAGVDLELPTLPFTGSLKIFDKPTTEFPGGRLLSEHLELVEFFGGDVYLYGTDLAIIFNGKELNTKGITPMGKMQNNKILAKMTAKNVSTGAIAENVELAIKQYNDEFGWEWVDIAHDEAGSAGVYANLLTFGTMLPGDSADFWVKIERNTKNWATKPTHFIFDINHK